MPKKAVTIKKAKKISPRFPDGFLWGAATSAYQVEGGVDAADWEVQNVLGRAGAAAEHYHKYEADFRIAKKLHQNAHRLSIEWSRIEPEEDVWNDDAIEHYYNVLTFLKKQGFTTLVTLHHFTNPTWVAHAGGWKNPKTITDFAGYAAKIAVSLGHLVDFWVTINEPSVYALLSHMQGIWPPFQKNFLGGYRVYMNMLKAHNKAYEIIKGYYPKTQVGLAQNIPFNDPADESGSSKLAARLSDYFSITRAFQGVRQDFIGLNYYFHNRVKMGLPKIVVSLPAQGELSDKGWEIYPQGIYEVLKKLKKYRKPIYITENGIADATDAKRAKFIMDHLKFVSRAIKAGVDVRGYFYWSLLDNYEWPVKKEENGFDMKFGLIEVDFQTQKRKVRKSAKIYAEICKSNSIET